MSEKGTRDIKKLSPKELGEQLVKLGIKAAEKERKPCPRRNERGC